MYADFLHFYLHLEILLYQYVTGRYRAGVVVELIMRLEFHVFAGLRFAEVRRSAHVILIQLRQKRLISSFRKHALFLQD